MTRDICGTCQAEIVSDSWYGTRCDCTPFYSSARGPGKSTWVREAFEKHFAELSDKKPVKFGIIYSEFGEVPDRAWRKLGVVCSPIVITADFSKVEMRVLAHMADDSFARVVLGTKPYDMTQLIKQLSEPMPVVQLATRPVRPFRDPVEKTYGKNYHRGKRNG